MRYISAIVTFLFILILVLFASSNKDETKLELFPLPQEITAPLYLLTFILVFIGFLVGAFVAWNAGRRHRRACKQANKRVQALELDVAAITIRADSAEERLAKLASLKSELAAAPDLQEPA